MNALIPRASVVAGAMSVRRQADLWRQSIAPMLEAVPLDEDEAATEQAGPEIHQYHLGRFLFMQVSFPSHSFRRDPALMARHDDADHQSLHVFLSGGNKVVNGGVDYTIGRNNVYGVNLAYEVDAVAEASRALMLVMPRQWVLDELPQLADQRGPLFADGSVCGQLLSDHLQSLGRLLPNAGTDSIPALTQSLLGLLDALSLHGDSSAAAAQNAMFSSVCRFIDAHLDDQDLGVERICGQFRCSRATLYRLFKSHGGVREHIQRRRLMACFKAIAAPRHQHRRIFDIALDFGFVSPSHFSHLFRSHFGCSPSDARDMGARYQDAPLELDMPSGGSATEDAERMWRWVKSLATNALCSGLGTAGFC